MSLNPTYIFPYDQSIDQPKSLNPPPYEKGNPLTTNSPTFLFWFYYSINLSLTPNPSIYIRIFSIMYFPQPLSSFHYTSFLIQPYLFYTITSPSRIIYFFISHSIHFNNPYIPLFFNLYINLFIYIFIYLFIDLYIYTYKYLIFFLL